ncbi:ABC transporter substrate-binding protein [Williamsia sp. 1138]|uniref:ABC transporter substrate-binding protein n=1 Tax=Williamsia sp. 1138 TaxID=1903117 RepID=UPI001FEED139|nr:ABC transporter substrate-binding protein [Williamsia sp. 1138]
MIARMSRPLMAVAGAALMSATLLSACGSDGSSGGGDAGPAQSGGTLRYGLSQAPTCSDPAQGASNQTIYVTRQVVDSLTDQDPKTGDITPWLAESWEISPDATSFTFKLKDGVTFSDGTPVTADSVKKNFDAIGTLGAAKAPLAGSYLSGYTGTTVVNPLTAQVNFAQPNAQFLQATSTSQLGLQADATVSQTAEQRCLGANIGSGPFTYSDWQQDRSVSLAKRVGYNWSSPVFAHTGEAYLDTIDFTVIPESGVRTGSLSSDQLDAVSDALPQDAPQIEATGGEVLTTPNPGVPFGFQPNVSRGVLADPAVRQALIPAINRQELIETVLNDDFKVATGSLAANTPGYKDLSSEVTFDQDKAKSILDKAGWIEGSDGIREKDGQKLSFTLSFSAVFAGNQAILELVQQQLKQVGVDLKLGLVSNAEFTALQSSGDYDAVYYNTTRADGDILRTTFGLESRNLNKRGPIPALDDALTAQLAATDKAQRDGYLATAQEQIISNGLWVPTTELSQIIGKSPKAQDLKFDASARLVFFDTWISGS